MDTDDGGSWPLTDRIECFGHQLPLLGDRAALEAWLADPRTVRLRDRLRFSPAHRAEWAEVEAMIEAAAAWAADDDTPQAGTPEDRDDGDAATPRPGA